MEHRISLFGPLLLIGAGIVWLLVQSGMIPSANLWALTHIWPFLLIAAGLGIMLRPYWKYTSILLDVILIGGALLAIIYAPRLGWATPIMFTFVDHGGPIFGPSEPGSGNVITQTREVSGFHGVEVSYPAQVLIQQGEAESVKIEAEDNVMPGLQTRVSGGTLEIFYKSDSGKFVAPKKLVKITITVKNLSSVDFSSAGDLTIEKVKTDNLNISLSGAGNLKLDEIHAQNLQVNLSGAGSMNASGTADHLGLNISGFGDFKGGELHGQTSNVSISGAGSATVWADDTLTAQVSGAGSINYYGSPSVSKQISGVGSVKQLGNK